MDDGHVPAEDSAQRLVTEHKDLKGRTSRAFNPALEPIARRTSAVVQEKAFRCRLEGWVLRGLVQSGPVKPFETAAAMKRYQNRIDLIIDMQTHMPKVHLSLQGAFCHLRR